MKTEVETTQTLPSLPNQALPVLPNLIHVAEAPFCVCHL